MGSPYSDRRKALSPRWLRRAGGDAWSEANGAVESQVLQAGLDAARARFPEFAATDALEQNGRDRQLERVAGESDASYAQRLKGAFATWALAGTRAAIYEALALSGWHQPRTYTNRDMPTAFGSAPDGDTTKWARWWLVLFEPEGFSDDGLWQDDGVWGEGGAPGVWGLNFSGELWQDDGVWGAGGPNDIWGDDSDVPVRLILHLCEKWQGAHNKFMGFWLVFAPPGDPWDTGLSAPWNEESVSFTDAGNRAVSVFIRGRQ